jgi:hypothetical protein
MPTAVDKLTKDSSADAIKEAVNSCIATEIRGGRERKQAVAMCYNMARKKTGRTQLLSPKKG